MSIITSLTLKLLPKSDEPYFFKQGCFSGTTVSSNLIRSDSSHSWVTWKFPPDVSVSFQLQKGELNVTTNNPSGLGHIPVLTAHRYWPTGSSPRCMQPKWGQRVQTRTVRGQSFWRNRSTRSLRAMRSGSLLSHTMCVASSSSWMSASSACKCRMWPFAVSSTFTSKIPFWTPTRRIKHSECLETKHNFFI